MNKKIFIGLLVFVLFMPLAQGFSLKWQTDINISSTKAPVCFDTDGDGDMEIFLAGNPNQGTSSGRIFCLDGRTGDIIWDESWFQSYQDPQAPLAIGDLDNNGDYEIVCAEQTHTVARNCEDGSLFWNSQTPSGWHHLSIVTINNQQYVFVTCNTGGSKSISKLKGTDGSLVAQNTVISYPCYGGISAGDINNDGKIEVLVNDGSMKCFDEDLNLMWTRTSDGESACPVLVDYNKDGYLDVIGLTRVSQSTGGLTIINGKDGTVIKTLHSQGLPTHITPAVYDIDKDGNLEFITAYGSHIFVYDMVLETIDAELNHEGYYYRGTHPPCVANVYGNSDLEIIVDGSWDGAVSIWDSNFNRIATIGNWGANVIVQDVDNDNLNEIILSRSNAIICYDTDAESLDADTSTHYYGNYRTGAETVYSGSQPPPPDVTCWACSNGNKISTTFPPETVCGQGVASNYPYASEPNDCSIPPTVCWKCVEGALEQLLVPNGGDCPEGWSETEPFCEPIMSPGFEILIMIFALLFILWRKKK